MHNWFKARHRTWILRAENGGFRLIVTDYVRWRYGVTASRPPSRQP